MCNGVFVKFVSHFCLNILENNKNQMKEAQNDNSRTN